MKKKNFQEVFKEQRAAVTGCPLWFQVWRKKAKAAGDSAGAVTRNQQNFATLLLLPGADDQAAARRESTS